MSERSSVSSYEDLNASDSEEDDSKDLFTNSHSKQVLNMMNALRKNGMLCDVTLVVDGNEYPAHRIVLAACSDYFRAMFTNEMSEKHQTRVELGGIPCSVMQVLLDFVYTETVRVSVENVQELLPAACLLQLVGVKQACAEFLQRQLEPSNCLGIRAFAERHSCASLQRAAAAFAHRHFEAVVLGDEFLELGAHEVEMLLGCHELQVDSEEAVFHACLRWVRHDLEAREGQLPQVLQHVRMPLLSARCITDIVDTEDLVRKSLECRDLVDEAKRFHLRPDLRGNMRTVRTQPRVGCTDVLVVLGGFGAQQNPVDSVEKYDPRTCEWSKLPPIPKRRRYVSAAAMGSCLYVIGGYDGHTRLATVEMMDLSRPKTGWRPVSPMHHRRGLAGVCTSSAGCSGKELLYVCGGFDGSVRHTTMERYDPQIDQWTLLCAMQTGREGAGLVPAHSSLYCVGGYDGTTLLNSVERYDLHTSQWGSIPPMATKRSGAGVAVLNDVIYVCGGFDGQLHLASVECYHILSGQWSVAANLSIPRCYVGAAVLRGAIYVIAGYDGTSLLDNIEVFDSKKDCWCILDKGMTAQRCDAGVAVVHLK